MGSGGITSRLLHQTDAFLGTSLTGTPCGVGTAGGQRGKESGPAAFRQPDPPIHRLQCSDGRETSCSRRSKQPEQKITADSPEESKEKLSQDFFF